MQIIESFTRILKRGQLRTNPSSNPESNSAQPHRRLRDRFLPGRRRKSSCLADLESQSLGLSLPEDSANLTNSTDADNSTNPIQLPDYTNTIGVCPTGGVTLSDITASLETSPSAYDTSSANLASTPPTSNAIPPSPIFTIQGIFVQSYVEQSLRDIYEKNIRNRLREELRGICRRGSWLLEFLMAGDRPQGLVPSIVVWCYSDDTKARVRKHFENEAWLQNGMHANGMNHYVLDKPPRRSAKPASRNRQPLHTLGDSSPVELKHTPTPCGVSLLLENGKKCIIGGLILVDGAPHLMTTRHGLDGLPRSFHGVAGVLAFESVGRPPDICGETSHHFNILCSPVPADEDSVLGYCTDDFDWALIDFSDAPSDLLEVILKPNMIQGKAIQGLHVGDIDDQSTVTLVTACADSQLGLISSGFSTLQIDGSLHDVMLITLDKPLPLGSSGTWVLLGDRVCGFIVAVREDLPWAYMIPMAAALDDIKRKLGTNDVCIPKAHEIESSRTNFFSERSSTSLIKASRVSAILSSNHTTPASEARGSIAMAAGGPRRATKSHTSQTERNMKQEGQYLQRTETHVRPMELVCLRGPQDLKGRANSAVTGVIRFLQKKLGRKNPQVSHANTSASNHSPVRKLIASPTENWANATNPTPAEQHPIQADSTTALASMDRLPQLTHENYATVIRNEMESSMKRNWEKKKYIPRTDLERIISKETVAKLINEDESLTMLSNKHGIPIDKGSFVKWVTTFASQLLALCIYVDLPLSCLYNLMAEDLDDFSLPLSTDNCPDEKYRTRWDVMIMLQGGFPSYTFPHKPGPDHLRLPSSTVMPIMFDESRDSLGEGSFARVYKVSIDSAHHSFLVERDTPFALKCFFQQGSRTEDDFRNEARVLQWLSGLPHQNLNHQLACWTQNGRYYILMPRAESSLKAFFEKTPSPELSNTTVSWFMSQLRGLADALKHLHLLGSDIPDPIFFTNEDPGPMKLEQTYTGCHFDLKPTNILVFQDKENDGPTLKISDFGSARIGMTLSSSGLQSESYFTNHNGYDTTACGAPDLYRNGQASRPYDIWSLGCIFLEFVTWMLGGPAFDPNEFAIQRLQETSNTRGRPNASFWYIDTLGDVHLKPAVIDKLEHLREECLNTGAFKHLIELIERLLAIRPKDRPNASTLCSELDAIILQVKADLSTDPQYYRSASWAHRARVHQEAIHKIASSLLEKGASKDTKDELGRSEVNIAAFQGNAEVVSVPLNSEADAVADVKERHGQTPLWQAAENGRKAVVHPLPDWEADDSPHKLAGQSIFTVPIRRHLQFVGRVAELHRLDQIFGSDTREGRRLAIVGLGGVGKSQIALEFAHRCRERDPNTSVFWIDASSHSQLEQGYNHIARHAQLRRRGYPKWNVFDLVSDWLMSPESGQWLMVLDNADDSNTFFSPQHEPVLRYIPQGFNGRVLVTSRDRRVALELCGDNIIDIATPPSHDSLEMLQKDIGPQLDMGESSKLVTALGYVPLAITQASAFIKRNDITVRQYLELFEASESNAKELLSENFRDSRRSIASTSSVYSTWAISFDVIQRDDPQAAELLSLMSLLGHYPIPQYILRDEIQNALEFTRAIGILSAFSFISSHDNGESFDILHLIQLSIKKWLESQNRLSAWQDEALRRLSSIFPGGEYGSWKRCAQLLPHADAVLSHGYKEKSGIIQYSTLQQNTGAYLAALGRYNLAFERVSRAVEGFSRILGDKNHKTLECVDLLALVLQSQGKYQEAEDVTMRTLATREKALGREHPDTLASLNNLASVLLDQGKCQESEEVIMRTLATREKVLGPEHPDTLASLKNLASVLLDQGKCQESKEVITRTLAATEKVLGPEHPDSLACLNNLALALQRKGEYDEAEAMNRRALTATENLLGLEHPDTLKTINNLASVLQYQGKNDEAEEMYRQVIVGYDRVLGKDHPISMSVTKNLVITLQRYGKFKEATEVIERVVRRRKICSEGNTSTFAAGYNEQGNQEEAITARRKQAEVTTARGNQEEAMTRTGNQEGAINPRPNKMLIPNQILGESNLTMLGDKDELIGLRRY
ncbi:hypothetical protein GJ744_009227 [Endocarpon pusillum]|uniref:Protein kinase domain-containing protein n=1 Tax=Endocarpon pusillum TaxID=364733 RepID=A0A8H7AI24_9EURO|nr:hypothetical protein GJ744_009227 [Endocarpon pusillum]